MLLFIPNNIRDQSESTSGAGGGNEGGARKFLRGKFGATKFFRTQKGFLGGGTKFSSKFWFLTIPYLSILMFYTQFDAQHRKSCRASRHMCHSLRIYV